MAERYKHMRIKRREPIVNIDIKNCPLFDGEPYVLKRHGKYHVFQGKLQEDDIIKWYDTMEEAVSEWNIRVSAMYNSVRG